MPALFVFLMGVGVLAWGVKMLASWHRPPAHHSPRYGGGIARFARRAWRMYAAGFLMVWFAFGCALIAVSVAGLMGHLPQFLR